MSKPSENTRELDVWIGLTLFGKSVGGSIPYYTTDPAAAMQVLEKCLSSDKLTMPIEMDRKRHKAGRFRIETGAFSNSIVEIDDTLPLAICRFAKSLFEK